MALCLIVALLNFTDIRAMVSINIGNVISNLDWEVVWQVGNDHVV